MFKIKHAGKRFKAVFGNYETDLMIKGLRLLEDYVADNHGNDPAANEVIQDIVFIIQELRHVSE